MPIVTVSRQQFVEQAIRFGSPGRVPIVFWNRDREAGDIMVEEYGVMGTSAENYRACAQAFRQLSCPG